LLIFEELFEREKMKRIILATLALALLFGSAYADNNYKQYEILLPNQVDLKTNFVSPQSTEMAQNWNEFKKQNGNWTVLIDNATKTPHRAFGKPISIDGFSKITNDNVESASLTFLRKYANTFNLNVNGLTFVRANNVNGKWYVSFTQNYQDKAVLHSEVELRISEDANVFAFGVSFYNDIDLNPTPSISYNKAVENSIADFETKSKNKVSMLSNDDAGKSFILPIKNGDKVDYKLVYDVKFRSEAPFGDFVSYVDAHSGDIIYRKNMMMQAGQSIRSQGEIKMRQPQDERQLIFFPYQHLLINGEKYTTDENGDLNVEVTERSEITAKFEGEFCKAYFTDRQNASYKDTVEPGEDFIIEWDDTNSHSFERNVYYHTNKVHSWIKEIDPNMTAMDFPVNVQLLWNYQMGTNASSNMTGDTLAFWNVSDQNLKFAETPGVLYHEYGHAINFRMYMDLGVPDGMQNFTTHEALADITACMILDDHRLGLGCDITRPDYHLRDLKNDLVYPEDIEGESHHDGQILGGAFWDLREMTSNEYVAHISHFARYGVPDDPNVGVAFAEWFIETIIADDDDNDLTNGTPHFQEILTAFNNHQIGTSLMLSSSFAHDPLQDTDVFDQDFRVDFEIGVPDFPNIKPESVKVVYSIDNWESQSELEANEYENNKYFANIPPQQEASIIQYYIMAKDNYSEEYIRLPLGESTETYLFLAGYYDYIYEKFEELGAWTIGADDDTAMNGRWQIGRPVSVNLGGAYQLQPGEDHSEEGVNCFCTDPSVSNYFFQHMLGPGKTSFISPVYDISKIERPVIRFFKWFGGIAFAQASYPEKPYFQVEMRYGDSEEWISIYKNTDGEFDWKKVVTPIPAEAHASEKFQLKFVANNTSTGFGIMFEALVDDFEILSANDPGPLSVEDDELLNSLSIHPNPFDDMTTIGIYLDRPTDLNISIYDMLGNPVFNAIDNNASGYWMYNWDGKDSFGNELSAGVYVININTGSQQITSKLIKK
jgi:hypothetical protein